MNKISEEQEQGEKGELDRKFGEPVGDIGFSFNDVDGRDYDGHAILFLGGDAPHFEVRWAVPEEWTPDKDPENVLASLPLVTLLEVEGIVPKGWQLPDESWANEGDAVWDSEEGVVEFNIPLFRAAPAAPAPTVSP